MPVLFAQRLRRSNEVVGFAAPEGLGGRWGVTDWLLNPGFWFLAADAWPPNFEF